MPLNPISTDDLENVSGGTNEVFQDAWRPATPRVREGYLALRSVPTYNDANEIDAIYPGNTFSVNRARWNGSYVWAFYKGKQGWVNADYAQIL